MNDIQIEENNKLKTDLNAKRKENELLCKELSIYDEEGNKLRNDNDDLRNSIIKLDKLVYGRHIISPKNR